MVANLYLQLSTSQFFKHWHQKVSVRCCQAIQNIGTLFWQVLRSKVVHEMVHQERLQENLANERANMCYSQSLHGSSTGTLSNHQLQLCKRTSLSQFRLVYVYAHKHTSIVASCEPQPFYAEPRRRAKVCQPPMPGVCPLKAPKSASGPRLQPKSLGNWATCARLLA